MADKNIDIKISAHPLLNNQGYAFVNDPSCGGIASFVGTVRKWNKEKEITHLFFEAYESMAISEMKKIANSAINKYGIKKISILHRVGQVSINEIAVVIYVSSVHRKAAFEACAYAIDELKKQVPIWKKEFLIDGSYWVNSRP